MDTEFIIVLLQNTILLVGVAILYHIFPYEGNLNSITKKVLSGIIIGIIGYVLMSTPFYFGGGIFFDTRSILLAVSGMFIGLIPTLIGGGILLIYRIYLGGGGVYAGSLTIIFSSLIGLLWRKYRLLKKDGLLNVHPFELYLVGVVVHIFMLSFMLTLPKDVMFEILGIITLPVLIIYPLGTLLLSLLMVGELRSVAQRKITKNSEKQYRGLFENSKVVLMLLNSSTADIIDVNQTAVDFYGWSLEKMKTMNISEINLLSLDEIKIEMERCLRLHKSKFIFKHRKASGEIVDVEIHSGPVVIGENEYLLSTIIDITAKLAAEKIIESKQDEINFMSYHDALTGLHNRYFFKEQLSILDTKRQLPISVIMGDVNGLKLTNDVFGHNEGDKLLQSVSNAIKLACRHEDIVARWGGDEFIVLLPQTNKEQAQIVVNRILDNISKITTKEKTSSITPSISLGYEVKTTEKEDIYEIIKIAESNMYKRKMLTSSSIYSSIIESLKTSLYERSNETELHAERLYASCKKVALKFDLSLAQMNELELFAMLHDIGKIGISDDILNKEGDLTEDEWIIMRTHPEIGYRIANSATELSSVRDHILSHHEHYDGSGYPRGLKGDEISLLSRILCVADAYDAITNDRPYQKARSKEEAIAELKRCSGTQFDPKIVKLFIKENL